MDDLVPLETSTDVAIAHGGRLADARRNFPGAPEPLVDLSTGINPTPYPIPLLSEAAFTRLPEPEDEVALCDGAARAYAVPDAAMVCAAPGTQILINLLPRLWPARRVAVLGPTYAEHAACWRASGAEVWDVEDVADLGGADVAVVCNPNNPDGNTVAHADLAVHADRLAARGGLLVVDEAFADLEAGVSITAMLPHPAIVVLRSLGKTYGLAGIRLGFALASPRRADVIRNALGPWAVSGPAITIGRAALVDTAWRDLARSRLITDIARLDLLLAGAGMQVVGGTLLFRLAEHPDARHLYDRLGEAGIMVRRFFNRPRRLRFGLPGTDDAWTRLAHALA